MLYCSLALALYLVVNINISQPPNQPPNTEPKPDCNTTYTSIDETKKLASPLIVCKLDLSKVAIKTIPAEVYTFTNLLELNLGDNPIDQAEIDKLQKALPKCNIKYTKQNPPANKETAFGFLQCDAKGIPDNASMNLLDKIAKQLLNDAKSKIRLEAQYASKEEYAAIGYAITNVKNILAKDGVNMKLNTVAEKITADPLQQQQQNIKKAPDQITVTIKVIGINFPENASAK